MAHHRKFERFMLSSHCPAFAAARDVAAQKKKRHAI